MSTLLNREHVTDALRFWERGRIFYNALLVAIVVAGFVWSGAEWTLWLPLIPGLFMFAVVANVLYCAAYPVDLFVQASDFREQWRGRRWILWAVGAVFAATLATGVLYSGPLYTEFGGV